MLNFDPHKWLAERYQTAPTLAELAGLAVSPAESALALEGAVSQPVPAKVAKAANLAGCQRELDRWCDAINRLELEAPAPGFTPARWRTLFDCSHWWMRNYAVQAARDGWGAGDVFGIRPGLPGQGGLIDQLGICRTLLMADGGARWRSWGVIGTYAAGAYPLLQPFWEGDHGARQS